MRQMYVLHRYSLAVAVSAAVAGAVCFLVALVTYGGFKEQYKQDLSGLTEKFPELHFENAIVDNTGPIRTLALAVLLTCAVLTVVVWKASVSPVLMRFAAMGLALVAAWFGGSYLTINGPLAPKIFAGIAGGLALLLFLSNWRPLLRRIGL